MLSCDEVHATRDYELVGFHVFALHNDSQIITPILCLTKVNLRTSLLIAFFPRWINSGWGRQSSNRNHCDSAKCFLTSLRCIRWEIRLWSHPQRNLWRGILAKIDIRSCAVRHYIVLHGYVPGDTISYPMCCLIVMEIPLCRTTCCYIVPDNAIS